MREAVAEVVQKQVGAGIDLVNDGEMSKPSYATYVKDRLAGFGGTGNTFVYQDLAQFPRLEKRVFGDPGRSRRKTPACNGPIGVRDAEAAQMDVDNLKAATAGTKATATFMSAASPGVVSLFFRNDHYKDHETYLYADRRGHAPRVRDRDQGRHRAADRLPGPRHGPAHPIWRPDRWRSSASGRSCTWRR